MSMDGCISERRLVRNQSESRLLQIGLLVVFAATGYGAAKPALQVTDVRSYSMGDVTRVAIVVSGEFRFESVRLNGPDRVFFDIQGSRLAMASGKSSTLAVKDPLLKQVRMAENQGSTRVVLDLEDGVEYTASQLSNPERLMVELRPRTKTPAASAPAPPKQTSTRAPVPEPPAKADSQAFTATSSQLSALMVPPVFASMTGASASSSNLGVAANVAPTNRAVLLPPPSATIEIEPAKAAKTLKSSGPAVPEPKPAARNANGERSLTRVLGLKLNRIVIDPGHGGHDVGTHGKSGMLEKDLVLDVSKRLAVMLEERMGVEVILTRDDDTFLSLEERTRLANQTKADLFLSVHANSSPLKSVAGVETFYLNFNAGRDDTDLAMRENAASERSIADLKDAVSKIVLRAKLDESREFALRVQNALHNAAAKANKEAKDRGVKRAPFVVLIGADMPSVLAEIGFLSNGKDEDLLRGSEHRDRLAESLYKGIAAYADSLSKTTEVARAR